MIACMLLARVAIMKSGRALKDFQNLNLSPVFFRNFAISLRDGAQFTEMSSGYMYTFTIPREWDPSICQ